MSKGTVVGVCIGCVQCVIDGSCLTKYGLLGYYQERGGT